MKLKPISLAVFSILCGYSSSSYSAPESTPKVTTTADIKTTPPTNLVQPYMPTRNMATWRFGVWRNWKPGKTGRYHEGIDFSGHGEQKQTLTSDGIYRYIGSKVFAFTIERPGGMGTYTFFHSSVLPDPKTKSNVPVKGGGFGGILGNRTGYDNHVHYQYNALCSSGLVRYTGVTGARSQVGRANYGGGKNTPLSTWGKVVKQSGVGVESGGRALLSPPQYCLTDPAPYLPNDRVFTSNMQDPKLDRYLGNSIYGQYNVLYNANLPIGRGAPGARAGTGGFASLPVYDNSKISPDQLANYNMNSVNGSMMAQEGGYNVDGQLVSQQVMASIFSSTDGSEWTTLPKPADPLDITKMSMKQIIEDSATKRFGDSQWDAALVKLSSKAMLNEYLLMEAEGNFLQQQNSRLKNRIEMLLAGMTQAQLFEFNKKIEAMNIAVNAGAVPRIIDVELAQLQGYPSDGVLNAPPSGAVPPDWNSVNKDDLNQIYLFMMKNISIGEATSYDAFNWGTVGKGKNQIYCDGFSDDTTARAMAQKYHGGVNVTDMTLGEALIKAKKPTDNCAARKRLTHGKYQFVPETIVWFLNSKKRTSYVNLKYVPEAQEFTARWRINVVIKDFITGKHSNVALALEKISGGWESIGIYNPKTGLYTKSIGGHHGAALRNQAPSKAVHTALFAMVDWHKKYGATKTVSIDPMTDMIIVKDK